MDDIWFQLNGANFHTANVTIDLLLTVFENRIISRNSDVDWPPRSCNLTPLDGFFGEALRISVTLTIQRRLRPWNTKSIRLMGYCKASRGSHLNDVVFHS